MNNTTIQECPCEKSEEHKNAHATAAYYYYYLYILAMSSEIQDSGIHAISNLKTKIS